MCDRAILHGHSKHSCMFISRAIILSPPQGQVNISCWCRGTTSHVHRSIPLTGGGIFRSHNYPMSCTAHDCHLHSPGNTQQLYLNTIYSYPNRYIPTIPTSQPLTIPICSAKSPPGDQFHLFFLVLSYVYAKQPIFGLAQEWFRELSFSRLKCVSSERHRDTQSLM